MSMGELPPEAFRVVHPWADVDRDGRLDDLDGVPQTWIARLTHPVLYTTPLDVARWMQALFQERRVLSERPLKEMLTVPSGALPDRLMRSTWAHMYDVLIRQLPHET